MEQKIRDRYHDSILQEAMRRYGIGKDWIRPLNAFESFIFEFERGPGAYVLRLSHSLRRSEALIQGEVDWINYLAEGGVSVARAIHSETGKLVEMIEDGQGGFFMATAFIKARGQSPWRMGWTPAIYEAYGKLLGRMHALATRYQPADPTWKRPDWDDELLDFVGNFLPDSERVVRMKYEALLKHLYSLPKENKSYGLIHQDAHGSNFLVDEVGNLTLFDFDDCVYSWYMNDIAIALFYTVMDFEDAPTFTREFMAHFLKGYQQVYPLDPKWLKEIPYFLKLREIELYAVMHRDFDVNNIDNEWCERFMRDRKTRIEHDVPFVNFDFESLYALR